MIDGLIAGRLYGKPTERWGQNGKAFVVAKIRVAPVDGESLIVNAIVFSDSAKAALLTLDDGDSVALAGTLTPKVWTDKHGDAKPALDLVVHGVLSAYHVRKRREAISQASDPKARVTRASAAGKQKGLREARAVRGNSTTATIHDDDIDF